MCLFQADQSEHHESEGAAGISTKFKIDLGRQLTAKIYSAPEDRGKSRRGAPVNTVEGSRRAQAWRVHRLWSGSTAASAVATTAPAMPTGRRASIAAASATITATAATAKAATTPIAATTPPAKTTAATGCPIARAGIAAASASAYGFTQQRFTNDPCNAQSAYTTEVTSIVLQLPTSYGGGPTKISSVVGAHRKTACSQARGAQSGWLHAARATARANTWSPAT